MFILRSVEIEKPRICEEGGDTSEFFFYHLLINLKNKKKNKEKLLEISLSKS